MGATGDRRQRKRAVAHSASAALPAGFDAVDDPQDPYYFPLDNPSSPRLPAQLDAHNSTASPDKRPRTATKPLTAEAPRPAATSTPQTAKQTPSMPSPPVASPPAVRSPTRPAVQLPPAAVRIAKPAPPPSQGSLINLAAARTLFRSSSGGGAALAVVAPPAATTISEVRPRQRVSATWPTTTINPETRPKNEESSCSCWMMQCMHSMAWLAACLHLHDEIARCSSCGCVSDVAASLHCGTCAHGCHCDDTWHQHHWYY